MNLEFFIAKRIFWGKDSTHALSKPIVNIAVAGIATGIAVMILSIAIVTGFRQEITKKVTGFEAHIKVVSLLEETDEYNKLVIDRGLLEKLKADSNVALVQLFAQQPGILEYNDQIQSVLIKGLDTLYNREFFKGYLKEGTLPDGKKGEVMLSSFLADKLGFKAGDKIRLYFVNPESAVKPRNFKVTGIFDTGLEVFDKQMVFISLSELQKIKGYGIQAYIKTDTADGNLRVEASAFGGDRHYRYLWSNKWVGKGPHTWHAGDDPNIRLIVTDRSQTIADTAWLNAATGQTWTSGGSDRYYTEGYEIFLKDINKLEKTEERLYDATGYNLTTRNVKEDRPEIFNWLEILNVNVYIIIILMVVVAVINMCSALLILILERANMVGIFKALGAANYSIRKIFLYNALLLIARGLLWGNIAGIALALIQDKTGIITLPEKDYYLPAVPISLQWSDILFLNLGTAVVTMIVLIFPSMLISRLSPAKTIRFD